MGLEISEASKELIAYFRYHLPHAVWNQYYDREDSDLKQILNQWQLLQEENQALEGSQLLVTYEADLPALRKSIIETIYDEWRIEDLSRDTFLVLSVDLIQDRIREFEEHPSKFRITKLDSGFPRYVEDFLIETSRSSRSLSVGLQQILLEKSFSNQKIISLAEKFFFSEDGNLDEEKAKKAQTILEWLEELDNKE